MCIRDRRISTRSGGRGGPAGDVPTTAPSLLATLGSLGGRTASVQLPAGKNGRRDRYRRFADSHCQNRPDPAGQLQRGVRPPSAPTRASASMAGAPRCDARRAGRDPHPWQAHRLVTLGRYSAPGRDPRPWQTRLGATPGGYSAPGCRPIFLAGACGSDARRGRRARACLRTHEWTGIILDYVY